MSQQNATTPATQQATPDPKTTILVKISSVKDSGLGCWLYTHFCVFPNYHPNHRYDVKASMEGFMAMTELWKKAGYIVVFENEYPK